MSWPTDQGFGSGVAYVASKHSVTIVTEALEHQLRTTEGNQISVHGLFPAMVETGFKDNAMDNLGEGADEEALAQTDVSSQWHLGLSPAELVDLLAEGIEQGIFYIRACAQPCQP